MGYEWFWLRFDGRINRARYLLATLAILGAMMAVVVLLTMLGARYRIGDGRYAINLIIISASIELSGHPSFKTAWWFPGMVTLPSALTFAWAYVAVSIKRLHDRNKSGWWMIPFAGLSALYVQFGHLLGQTPAYFGLVSGLLLLWGFVEMGFVTGTSGPNRFGPDPLAPQPDTTPRRDQCSELPPG
jgi:uncharacterized membrane protein YhaH (DUF805 family)